MLKKKMWGFLWLFTLLFVLALPCFAELTKEDVRQIVREEIEPLKIEIQALKITVTEMDKRIAAQFSAVDSRFDAVDYRFSILQWFITGLVAITVAAIAIPQLLIAYRGVKQNRQKAVLMDWDGTMRRGFTLLPWVEFLKNKGIFSDDTFRKINSTFNRYKTSEISHDKLCKITAILYAKGLQGCDYNKILSIADEFALIDQQSLYPFVQNFISIIRKQHMVPILISGAPIEILRKYSNLLGIEKVFGLKLKINKRGVYTGKIEENPGLQSQKKEYVNRLSHKFDFILAIGDSKADTPLLLAARMSIVVNGSVKHFPEAVKKQTLFLNENQILDKTPLLLSKFETGGF